MFGCQSPDHVTLLGGGDGAALPGTAFGTGPPGPGDCLTSRGAARLPEPTPKSGNGLDLDWFGGLVVELVS